MFCFIPPLLHLLTPFSWLSHHLSAVEIWWPGGGRGYRRAQRLSQTLRLCYPCLSASTLTHLHHDHLQTHHVILFFFNVDGTYSSCLFVCCYFLLAIVGKEREKKLVGGRLSEGVIGVADFSFNLVLCGNKGILLRWWSISFIFIGEQLHCKPVLFMLRGLF